MPNVHLFNRVGRSRPGDGWPQRLSLPRHKFWFTDAEGRTCIRIAGPDKRRVLYRRQPHGYLIPASSGVEARREIRWRESAVTWSPLVWLFLLWVILGSSPIDASASSNSATVWVLDTLKIGYVFLGLPLLALLGWRLDRIRFGPVLRSRPSGA